MVGSSSRNSGWLAFTFAVSSMKDLIILYIPFESRNVKHVRILDPSSYI